MVTEYWKKKIGTLPTHVTEFCDGAGSQFKCRDSWAQIADSKQDLGFPVTRHFFESAHGKGPHDGAGANIKNLVTKLNLQRVPSDEWYNKVTDAYQFYMCAKSGTYLTPANANAEPVEAVEPAPRTTGHSVDKRFSHFTHQRKFTAATPSKTVPQQWFSTRLAVN